jgi:uncharacterized membrane protein YhaH (DUF805 family)
MDVFGINWIYLIIQLVSFSLYLLISLFGLFSLRLKQLNGIQQVLWAILIIVVPVFGTLAFFIVKPGEKIQT